MSRGRSSRVRLPRWHQVLRKTLQVAVLVYVVYAAAGTTWRNYKVAHNSSRLVALIHGDRWGEVYAANEKFLENFGKSYDASMQLLGMPWAGRVLGFDTVDPLMATAHAVQTRSVHAGLWLGVLLPLIMAALLGKFFCSHLCPMRLLFELGQLARRGLVRMGIPLPELKLPHRLGGWVLLGGLLATIFAGTSVWLLVLPYAGMSAAIFLLVAKGVATALVVPVALWLAVDMLVSPGLWCRDLCPTGWLLEQAGRLSPWRLRKVKAEACPSSCNLCEQACPYRLQPQFQTHNPACDTCGACVGVCPSDRLARTVSLSIGGAGRAGPSQGSGPYQSDNGQANDDGHDTNDSPVIGTIAAREAQA